MILKRIKNAEKRRLMEKSEAGTETRKENKRESVQVRYTLKKKIRDYLGIIPNMGGYSQFPKLLLS